MKHFIRVLALAGLITGCAGDSSLLGLDDRHGAGGPHELFISGLGLRTVGDGAGGRDTVRALYVSTEPGSTVIRFEVWVAPGTVRTSAGTSVPDAELAVGRKVRVWQPAGPTVASNPPVFTADSIIVLD